MKLRMTIVKLGAGTSAAAIFMAGFLLVAQPVSTEAAADDVTTIYKTKCSVCHALDGSGNTAQGKALKVRDLRSAEAQKMTDAQMSEIIIKGKKKMPALGKNFSQDQVNQLVAHIRAMAKKG